MAKASEPFDALAPVPDDLPSAAELAWYANLNYADRRTVELALGGEVFTT